MSIYIVTNKVNAESNIFKIGKSTQSQVDLIKRYKTALGNPHIVFHHLCSNYADVERAIHSKLQEYRVDGECFEVDYFVMMETVIDVLKGGKHHFKEYVKSDLNVILNRLTKKDLEGLGIKDAKKELMVVELKKNLSLLYRLDSIAKMKITKTESEKDALKIIDSLINTKAESLSVFEEKALKALKQNKKVFISLLRGNPRKLDTLINIAIANNNKDYIIDYAIDEGRIDIINKLVNSKEAIIERCIKEERTAILSALFKADMNLLAYCQLAIDYNKLDVIDMILGKQDLKTEIVMYAAQCGKKDIVDRYVKSDVTRKACAMDGGSSCEAVIKSGEKTGQKCGQKGKESCKGSWYCGRHIKGAKQSNPNQEVVVDISQEFVNDILNYFYLDNLRALGGVGRNKKDVINSIVITNLKDLITITDNWLENTTTDCPFTSNINAIACSAATHGYKRIVKLMLKMGADNHRKIYNIAMEQGHSDIAGCVVQSIKVISP